MTKDEAMKLALETLVEARDDVQNWGAYASEYFQKKHDLAGHFHKYEKAITALRQALEQPEQKPVAYLYHDTVSAEFANPLADSTLLVLACDRKPNGRNETPLYTAPPKQETSIGLIASEWAGLEEPPNSTTDVVEPVAWMQADQAELYVKEFKDEVRGYTIPLYAAPPKREWVGLTDEELISVYESEQAGRWGDHIRSLRAIEAKLKENNK